MPLHPSPLPLAAPPPPPPPTPTPPLQYAWNKVANLLFLDSPAGEWVSGPLTTGSALACRPRSAGGSAHSARAARRTPPYAAGTPCNPAHPRAALRVRVGSGYHAVPCYVARPATHPPAHLPAHLPARPPARACARPPMCTAGVGLSYSNVALDYDTGDMKVRRLPVPLRVGGRKRGCVEGGGTHTAWAPPPHVRLTVNATPTHRLPPPPCQATTTHRLGPPTAGPNTDLMPPVPRPSLPLPQTARDADKFLRGWFARFPQYLPNEFFISGACVRVCVRSSNVRTPAPGARALWLGVMAGYLACCCAAMPQQQCAPPALCPLGGCPPAAPPHALLPKPER